MSSKIVAAGPGVTGAVVDAQDAADVLGPTTTDACSPLTNAAAVAGKIALVERGTCTFARKARTVEDAGAIGMIIYNNAANAAAAPVSMAGDATVIPQPTITTVSLTRADGVAVLAQIPSGTTATMSVDLTIRAGADLLGRARLYAPFPVVSGSSISHYDTVASRNLLMEPAINGDLTHNVKSPDDLTLELLRDVGWFPDADVDGIADGVDNCVTTANPGQGNNDGDALGDVCDPDDDNDGQSDVDEIACGSDPLSSSSKSADNDGDNIPDCVDTDDDNDGVADSVDNCQFTPNPSQADTDGDGLGNACDSDDDNDGLADGFDNCPLTFNPNQADFDLDGIGDACDPQTGPPQNMDQCKNDGWKLFDLPRLFKSQGDCIQFVNTSK